MDPFTDSPDEAKYQFNMGFETLKRINYCMWGWNQAYISKDWSTARLFCDNLADELSPFFSDLDEYEEKMQKLNLIVEEVDAYHKLMSRSNPDDRPRPRSVSKLWTSLRKYQRKLRGFAHELKFLMKETDPDEGL